MVPPRGATTWCHHPGPLTLPKSARNKDPPEGAPYYLVFFLNPMETRYKNKDRLKTKNKSKVFLYKTPFFVNLYVSCRKHFCWGSCVPPPQIHRRYIADATGWPGLGPKAGHPLAWVFHPAATPIKMRMRDRPFRGHHDRTGNAGLDSHTPGLTQRRVCGI